VVEWRTAWTPTALENSPGGRAALADFIRFTEPRLRRVYEMTGTELGYRYGSTIVAEESGTPPPDEAYVYRPTTWPGAHLPHMWLTSGVSVYDRLVPGFTLLALKGGRDVVAELKAAFQRRGAPLNVVELSDPSIRAIYNRDYLLVRPDLHVAWRGDALPENPAALADLVLGFTG
jgi:hypothetical protein